MNTIRLGSWNGPLQLNKPLSAICAGGLIGAHMDCKQYSIYQDVDGGWFAHLHDRVAGPYLSHGLVLRVVTTEIVRVRKLGANARLVVKNASGTVRAQRCFCEWLPNCPQAAS